MSAAFVDEDFTPVAPPLHGNRAEAAARQAAIHAETQRKFAEQDARLERLAEANRARAEIDAALAEFKGLSW